MGRTRAERRRTDFKKAIRKRNLAREIYPHGDEYDYYDNLHQYADNKIHCSCGMCSRYEKTNNKGSKRKISGNFAPSYNPSMADMKKLAKLDASEEEYIEETENIKEAKNNE